MGLSEKAKTPDVKSDSKMHEKTPSLDKRAFPNDLAVVTVYRMNKEFSFSIDELARPELRY
jgi:hypothetical protein